MKKVLKNSLIGGAIFLIALVVFCGSYLVSSKLKVHRDAKRIQNMYSLFMNKGKLHTERHAYTYLTKVGKQRLNNDLSFNQKKLPADTLTAFSEENLVLVPYHYQGTVKLPKNPQKGKRLYFKVPFPVTVSSNLIMTVYYNGKAVDYDSTNVLVKNKKKENYCYIYLGESTDEEGKLIKDLQEIHKQAGQMVNFEINNVEQISEIPHRRELLKHPNLFYTATELLNKPEISLTVGYHVKHPKFTVMLRNFDSDNLKIKIVSNKINNYERKIKLKLEPQGKLLSSIKNDLKHNYQVNLLYNGLVIKNKYYITNNLAALSNYNHGK